MDGGPLRVYPDAALEVPRLIDYGECARGPQAKACGCPWCPALHRKPADPRNNQLGAIIEEPVMKIYTGAERITDKGS